MNRLVVAVLLAVSAPQVTKAQQGDPVTPDLFQLACDEITTTSFSDTTVYNKPDDPAGLKAVGRWCGVLLGNPATFSSAVLPSRDALVALAVRARARVETTTVLVQPAGVAPAVAATQPAAPASSPGLTQAEILFGITDFLIESTEAQVQSWLLPRLHAAICLGKNSSKVQLDWIFSETCALLAGSAPAGLATAASVYRAAVRRDVSRMPYELLDRAAALDSSIPAWKIISYASAIAHVVEGVGSEQISIARLLADLPDPPLPLARLSFFAGTVLRHAGSDTPPRSAEEWLNMIRAAIYNMRVTNGGDCDNGVCGRVVKYAATFRQVRDHLAGAHDALRSLRNLGAGTVGGDAMSIRARRMDLRVLLLQHVTDAMLEAVGDKLDRAERTAVETIARAAAAVEVGDFGTAVAGVASFLNTVELEGLLGAEGLRLLTFAGDISQAATSDDVKDAIKAFASEAAGRDRKRTRDHGWVLGLQGYGGVALGLETALTSASNDPLDPVAGLFLPVGFEVTFPSIAIGVFIQILDLGALGTARLSGSVDDDGNELGSSPELGFKQVVAPGAYLTWAVPQTPLSLGAGVSRASDLRSVSRAGVDMGDVDVWRLGVFAAIDIPIFP